MTPNDLIEWVTAVAVCALVASWVFGVVRNNVRR